MKKIYKDRNGVTLVELIIGMVIFSIITLSVITIMNPTLQIIRKSRDISEMNRILNTVSSEVTHSLEYAKDIVITSDGSSDKLKITMKDAVVEYSVTTDGILSVSFNGGSSLPLIGSEYYNKKTIQVRCQKKSANGITNLYDLQLTVVDAQGHAMITRNYLVNPLVLNQYY